MKRRQHVGKTRYRRRRRRLARRLLESSDAKMIREALTKEGKLAEDGALVVPGDFFQRLNATLNPPSILDQLIKDSK